MARKRTQSSSSSKPKKSSRKSKAVAQDQATLDAAPETLSDDQRCKLLLQGIVKLENLIQQAATINSSIRKQRKQLKADGFEKFEVDYALRLRKQDKKEEELDRRRREAEIAKMFNHPVWTQGDLFEGVDRTPAVDTAYKEGKLAGMEGKVACSPPYDASTPQGQNWITGWHDGQAVKVREGIKRPAAPVEHAVAAEGNADGLPVGSTPPPNGNVSPFRQRLHGEIHAGDKTIKDGQPAETDQAKQLEPETA